MTLPNSIAPLADCTLVAMVVLCAVVGAWIIGTRILWPVVEAIIYGHVPHLIEVVQVRVTWAGWRTAIIAPPLFAIFLLANPWRHAWRRLFGSDAYVTEITTGRWTYCPPFFLKHNICGEGRAASASTSPPTGSAGGVV